MAGAIEMSSFLSIVVAVTLSQPLDGTVSLCTVVARRLRHFTNTPQIHQVLEAVFSKKSKMLPTVSPFRQTFICLYFRNHDLTL